MTHRDYGHRDAIDKLGIKPGHAVAWGFDRGYLGDELKARILDRVGRALAADDEPCDVVLIDLGADDDPVAEPTCWRARLRPSGGIWLLTRKRGLPAYVDQRELIAAGTRSGVVDNKVCSVSDTIGAMRFVIRKTDRLSQA